MLYRYGYNPIMTEMFCLYNYWSCRLFDPDTDMIGTTTNEGEGLRVFGKVWFIGWILKALWLAYTTFYAGIMLAFGGHRNFLSHSLFISTIIRIIYFDIPIFFLMREIYLNYYSEFSWQIFWNFFNMSIWYIPYIFTRFVMLSLGDAIHLLLDTNMVKGILYTPVTSRTTGMEREFNPKWDRFIKMMFKVILGYAYNKFNGIKNLKLK